MSLTATACGDEATVIDNTVVPLAPGDTAEPEAPATGTDPLYAMMIQVYTADDRIVYVHLTKDPWLG